MKKFLPIVLMILCAFSSVQSFAQTFVTQSSDSVIANTNGASETSVYNKIKSNTSGSVNITWHVIDYSFAPHMGTGGICDINLCYGASSVFGSPANPSFNGTYTSTYGDFHVIFTDTNAAVGATSWVRIAVSSGATSRTLTFIVNKTATGITTTVNQSDNVTIFPNPARESINVLFDAKSNVKTIAVYNLIGKTMQVYKPTDDNSANLNIENIPSGIYFMRLMNGQGQVVATRRFTRQ